MEATQAMTLCSLIVRLLLPVMATVYCLSAARGEDAPDPFSGFVAPSEPLSAAEQQKKFHLPAGFEIQLVAAEPEIRKPINLAFDARGNLWATQSIEYPFGAAKDQTARDEVRVFENLGADGRPERSRTFAAGLNIPIGLLPLRDGAIVFGIPYIRRLTDRDRDGQADDETLLYGPFGAQDTHGMCNAFRRGLDGWIYACHGYANTSTVRGADDHEIVMHSGNAYRFRADGSHIEYFTHGQVNPFGLAFDPLGNLYSADCHSLPLYTLLRGAFYPSFGKPDDGLGFGPPMLNHLHGSTGIAGVAYYAADHFPEAWQNTVFIGNPVTGRINHDRLEPHGSTFAAIEQPDFLSCDDPWFRPVDVRLGPDGALYIADFYNCIIGHYEVPLTHPRRDRALGRIWRVVYRGEPNQPAPPPAMPDLTTSTLTELVWMLGRANLELRTLATHELVDRFAAEAAPPLQTALGDENRWRRIHAMWALERLGAVDDSALSHLWQDDDATVRAHALRLLAERPSWSDAEGQAVLERLSDVDSLVRRVAADALGRHPTPAAVAKLLALWRETPTDDTHLIHVVRMALRDHLQTPWGPEAMTALIDGDARLGPRVAEIALGVRAAPAAALVLDRLQRNQFGPAQLEPLVHHATRYAAEDRLQATLDYALSRRTDNVPTQATVLRAVDRAVQERGAKAPAAIVAWGDALARDLLESQDEATLKPGIELAQALRLRPAHARLAELAARIDAPPALRDQALGACVAIDGAGSAAMLEQVVNESAAPMNLRQRAARELAGVGGLPGRQALANALATAPERLAVEIAAALAGSDEGVALLLDAVASGKAAATLLQEWGVNLRFNGRNVPNLKDRVAELTRGLPPADQRLRELVAARRDGFHVQSHDAAQGQQVFVKHCAACHRLAGQGSKIGPELEGIGNRGLERVLEDVLNPNGNVDQAFRSTTLALTDGRTLQGLALREEGSVLILADAQGKEQRVSLSDIEDRQVTPLSPMPANVADLVPEAEFYHLLAYLLEQRQKPQSP